MLVIKVAECTIKSPYVLFQLAELLINSGLRPDALDKFGCSPAQYAILHRHFGLADFLAGNDIVYE